MSRWGKVDYRQFERFKEKLDKLQGADTQKFCEAAAKELAARLLGKVIRRTPVGQYPKGSGMTGGTLRRGWTGQVEKGSGGAVGYAQSLPVTKQGNTYIIDVINPVAYASYVEFGHRTRGHKGWVEGRFMLTKSEIELAAQAPKILEKKLALFLGEYLNGE